MPSTVAEGGTIAIDLRSGAGAVFVSVPGVGTVRVAVINGVAEYRLPPSVPGGTIIFISDCKLPNPAGATVHVVSNQ